MPLSALDVIRPGPARVHQELASCEGIEFPQAIREVTADGEEDAVPSKVLGASGGAVDRGTISVEAGGSRDVFPGPGLHVVRHQAWCWQLAVRFTPRVGVVILVATEVEGLAITRCRRGGVRARQLYQIVLIRCVRPNPLAAAVVVGRKLP